MPLRKSDYVNMAWDKLSAKFLQFDYGRKIEIFYLLRPDPTWAPTYPATNRNQVDRSSLKKSRKDYKIAAIPKDGHVEDDILECRDDVPISLLDLLHAFFSNALVPVSMDHP